MELQQIEQIIRDGELLAVRANERYLALRKQFGEKKAELEALGIDPKTAEQQLIERKEALAKKEAELLALLPVDIIEQYKGYDFSESTESPDLTMPF